MIFFNSKKTRNQIVERCYLCGTDKEITRDHLPPKCLFPKPRPSTLITIPCCRSCNNSASQDDEYLRLATSSLINAHPISKTVWERVVKSTFKERRIGKLIDELKREAKPTVLSTPWGDINASELPIDLEPIGRSLIKITRGILSQSHPEVDTARLDYHITHIDQFKLESLALSGISKFTRFQVGDVYTNWRAVSPDHNMGLMVHMFYGAATWMVQHNRGSGTISVFGASQYRQSIG